MDLSIIADNMTTIVVILSDLIALGGIWWAFVKWFWPLMKDVHRTFKQLDVIASEFKTNGGSSLRDVINRVEANVNGVREDALKMEARQWAIIATLKDPIFEANKEGLCVRANPSYLALVERTLEDVIGNGWENILHPDERVRVWNEWNDAIARRRTFESSYKIKSATGSVYQVNCVAIPYFSTIDLDMPIGYIGRFDSVRKIATK